MLTIYIGTAKSTRKTVKFNVEEHSNGKVLIVYNACYLVFIQLHMIVSQLVLEMIVTTLELVAGCSVAPVNSGITVCV